MTTGPSMCVCRSWTRVYTMERELLRQFQIETFEQCKYILIAASNLQRHISIKLYDDLFWYELQNFVVSAANVSKLLWGQGGRLAEQRKPLRDSIQVEDSTPLKPPATMRNHFEHIDERLDRWWESGSRNQVNRNIGSVVSHVFGFELKEVDRFRGFDPSTGIVTFWGDTYNLVEIVQEVGRIYPLLEIEASKPPRED
jgi:hypothetical protein